ncbi:MAG: hypothetical protein OJF52_002717 [Nitrospira sp.]|nr:MAG: hypothetical protein OJF52_002717 [Nitrospira sp.]
MKTLSQRRWLAVLAAMSWLSGCGTNMHSDKQSVTIFSLPPGAKVTVDSYLHVTAPGTVSLSRKSDHVAVAYKEGYEPTELKIQRSWSWWVLGDVFGCFIVFSPFCLYKDVHDGGFYTFDDEVYLSMDQRVAADSAPPK